MRERYARRASLLPLLVDLVLRLRSSVTEVRFFPVVLHTECYPEFSAGYCCSEECGIGIHAPVDELVESPSFQVGSFGYCGFEPRLVF